MKLQTLLLGLCLLLALSSSAVSGENPAGRRSSAFLSLEEQLTTQLHTPIGVGRDRVIIMCFRVKNDLSIEVHQMEGGSTYLQEHVRKQLANGTFYINKTEVGKSYLIKMRFRS